MRRGCRGLLDVGMFALASSFEYRRGTRGPRHLVARCHGWAWCRCRSFFCAQALQVTCWLKVKKQAAFPTAPLLGLCPGWGSRLKCGLQHYGRPAPSSLVVARICTGGPGDSSSAEETCRREQSDSCLQHQDCSSEGLPPDAPWLPWGA